MRVAGVVVICMLAGCSGGGSHKDGAVDAGPSDAAADAFGDAAIDLAHVDTSIAGDLALCDVAKCPASTTACQVATCLSDGSCGLVDVADGTPVATQVAGDCKKLVCLGGTATSQTDDTDLPTAPSECTTAVCTSGVPSTPAKKLDTACGVGGTYFCDGNGTCAQCTAASQCPGPDTECQTRACNTGTCGFSYAEKGAAVATQTVGDCKKNECDGAGNVESVDDDSDISDDGNDCTSDTCSAGMPQHADLSAETSCGAASAGLRCNGKGSCVGCVTASDCGTSSNVCLAVMCSTAGVCGTGNVKDGTTCNDGNACSQTDQCMSGQCKGGNPVSCFAIDQCHKVGTCDSTSGTCSNPVAPDATICNDGNACTQTDQCMSGQCKGSNVITCTAVDACHMAGSCDPTLGTCSSPAQPNGTTCDDGSACTKTDTCQAGTCTGSNAVVCMALDQCHVAGVCSSSTGACSNPTKTDTTACDDGNACTTGDSCMSGTCTPTSTTTCAPPDQCHTGGACNTSTGACDYGTMTDGTSCSDGNLCTVSDACESGVCSGTATTCTAADTCHSAGTCDTTTGTCSSPVKSDGTSCDDGDACTTKDTCASGSCEGTAVSCNDECQTGGVCSMTDGTCSGAMNAMDGTTCTGGACLSGVCCQTIANCKTETCTTTSDQTCTTCDAGYYLSSDAKSCVACSTCPGGVATACGATTDTVCTCGVPVTAMLLWSIDLPAAATSWATDADVPYVDDNRAALETTSYARVGYCLTLDSDWVYTELDDYTAGALAQLDFPTTSVFANEAVGDLTIATSSSNVTATTLPSMSGGIDFFGNAYGPDPDTLKFDYGDSVNLAAPHAYGSFQVYDGTSTILSFNGWSGGIVPAVGIGNSPDPTAPDWTGAANAGGYTTRTLQAFIIP